MGGDKEEICFHIMHSMKGGCGKSTCALFKALQLATENMEKQAKVLFLDADFKGSALQPLLFRDTVAESEIFSQVLGKMPEMSVGENAIRHTIVIPDNYRKENNLSRFLRVNDFPFNMLVQKSFSYARKMDDPAGASNNVMNGYIDFILAAADSEDKDWFRYRKHNGKHNGKIASGIFINRMGTLMNFILHYNATVPEDNDSENELLGQYKDVVIDMPPGYDEYSDMFLEVLRRLATKDKRIKLHYYHVTTDDIGHMALALENIKKMCALETEFREFNKVNAILNNPFSVKPASGADEKSKHAEEIKDDMTIIREDIAALKRLLNEKGEVYYNEYCPSFHTYSTIMDRLEFVLDQKSVLKEQKREENDGENDFKSENNAGLF